MIKRDGERQRFDRTKLRAALFSATHKRPVIASDIEAIVDRIETAVGDGRGELSSERIGELCLEELRELDRGAYMQFAGTLAVRTRSRSIRSRPARGRFHPVQARGFSSSPRMPLEGEDLMAKIAAKDVHASEVGLAVERRFTSPGVHPFDEIEWEIRDAVIGDPENPAFEQREVEFPKSWSQNATNIVAQKYFRGKLGSPERESSVKQMISRVAGTIAGWGRDGGYFASDEDADAFEAELTHILLHQKAAFNSPVWFNVGWREEGKQQCSACFILSVEDTMESILDWNTQEGIIFKGGSGSGINLSKIRGSMEPLAKGGIASGPVSFMRGADSWAGAIKSGGGTRRAAKMVVLDVDHPDIEDFIWCKAREEEKAAALKAAGFDMRLDSEAFASVQYQNANNSVRVSDEFMKAVEEDRDWELTARVDGRAIKTVKARELMHQIADAAWRCADPGVQYDTTINRWHTCPESGRINASNPCSEYMHVDDSACNLASLNLMKFRNEDGVVQRRGLQARRRRRLPRPGDHRRAVELPDREDRSQRPRIPPDRARVRQPRRVPDGQRGALRLR